MNIEQMKKELKKLQSKRNELFEQRRNYKNKLENYKTLQYRSKCPCCEQKTNREYFKNKIPETKKKLERILTKISNNKEIKRLEKIIRINDENKNKEHRKQIKDYIQQNKNKLNKCIRDYNKGTKNYLPTILNLEKKTWNEAMERHTDNKNMIENDELYFEI